MSPDYLHNHTHFFDLVRSAGREKSINPILVEKDYWIMHCLYSGLPFSNHRVAAVRDR